MSSVFGIGVDIEEVSRFEELTGRWGQRFENRMYTAKEIEYCRGKSSPSQHFAARFAAKEAFAKAIGTGWTGAFRWKDVEVKNDEAGKPHFILHNLLDEQFGTLNIHLSLSHTHAYVTAMVVIQNSDE